MTDVMTDAELVKKALSYATIGTQGEVALQLAGNAVRVTREAYESRIQSLTADLERAKEALRPFAAIGEMANFAFAPALFQDADTIKKLPWRDGEEEVTITFGNVRHAAFTLKDISHD